MLISELIEKLSTLPDDWHVHMDPACTAEETYYCPEALQVLTYTHSGAVYLTAYEGTADYQTLL